jgi:hypothetical protein
MSPPAAPLVGVRHDHTVSDPKIERVHRRKRNRRSLVENRRLANFTTRRDFRGQAAAAMIVVL